MPLIRDFQEKEGIWIFDSPIDTNLSTYNASHLKILAEIEERHFWFKTRRDKICQIFQSYVAKPAKILEIGGGTGFIAAKLQDLGFTVEMADLHFNGLCYAKNKGITRLYQFDLFHAPFQEEFDVICLFDVLEHLHDPLQALKCLKSMLKLKGMIILTVPAHQWLWNRDDVIAGHQRRFTKSYIKTLFNNTQLQPIYIRYFFSAILPFLLLRKWIKKDDGSLLSPKETFAPKIHPLLNHLLEIATRSEFYFDRLLPNLAGGSLLGIAVTSPDKIP